MTRLRPPPTRTSLLGTVRATPMTSPVWLTVNGGASLIRRGGEAYAEAEDKSDVGPGARSTPDA